MSNPNFHDTTFRDTTCPTTGKPCRNGCFNLSASYCCEIEKLYFKNTEVDRLDNPDFNDEEDWFWGVSLA